MSESTKIEWTDATFNPWEGCQKVGPGCNHCYAEECHIGWFDVQTCQRMVAVCQQLAKEAKRMGVTA